MRSVNNPHRGKLIQVINKTRCYIYSLSDFVFRIKLIRNLTLPYMPPCRDPVLIFCPSTDDQKTVPVEKIITETKKSLETHTGEGNIHVISE